MREAALDEAGHRHSSFIAVQLAVGVARVIVDERVHPLVPNPRPLLRPGAIAIAGDRMPRATETGKTLGIDVQQITGARPLVAAGLLARLPRRPRDPGPLE